jgi:hypothetical protein
MTLPLERIHIHAGIRLYAKKIFESPQAMCYSLLCCCQLNKTFVQIFVIRLQPVNICIYLDTGICINVLESLHEIIQLEKKTKQMFKSQFQGQQNKWPVANNYIVQLILLVELVCYCFYKTND